MVTIYYFNDEEDGERYIAGTLEAVRKPMLSDIRGLICPLITPFDERGEIDHEAVRHNVEFLLAHGVQVLFPGGSTGEGQLLTVDERKALAETVLDQAAGRGPVLIHTGCMTTPRPSSWRGMHRPPVQPRSR